MQSIRNAPRSFANHPPERSHGTLYQTIAVSDVVEAHGDINFDAKVLGHAKGEKANDTSVAGATIAKPWS